MLGGSGRVRDRETISKEKKVKTKRTSEQSELGKRNKKNKTVLSQEAHSTAVDEHIEGKAGANDKVAQPTCSGACA